MIWWPAPAKLNLMLRVIRRRADGYHDLQTVFQFLDFGDDMAFVLTDGIIKRHEAIPGVELAADLTLRAAALLQASAKVSQGVEIFLRKRLPIGGGVGGGSSDAATTLRVLNQLWHVHYTESELAALGRTLGADVPVFVHGRAAWAEGIGDELSTVILPEPWYLVIKPDTGVATASIFEDAALARHSEPITIADFLSGDVRNDCVSVVCQRYPEIKQIMAWLKAQQTTPRLTGTGACVFAVFESHESASKLGEKIPSQWSFFIAKGKNLSPLLEKICQNTDNCGVT